VGSPVVTFRFPGQSTLTIDHGCVAKPPRPCLIGIFWASQTDPLIDGSGRTIGSQYFEGSRLRDGKGKIHGTIEAGP
jgi:hypothetical protein